MPNSKILAKLTLTKHLLFTPHPPPRRSIRVPFPLGVRPLPLPFAAFLLTFRWVASWSYEPNFWLNWRKIYYPSPDWSSAFCDRSTNVLSVAYTLHIRFVRFASVTHTAKSVSWPFFVRYLYVTYALLMLLCGPYTFRKNPHLHGDDFHHWMNTGWTFFLHFFCPFGIRYPYPLICDSTISAIW